MKIKKLPAIPPNDAFNGETPQEHFIYVEKYATGSNGFIKGFLFKFCKFILFILL